MKLSGLEQGTPVLDWGTLFIVKLYVLGVFRDNGKENGNYSIIYKTHNVGSAKLEA